MIKLEHYKKNLKILFKLCCVATCLIFSTSSFANMATALPLEVIQSTVSGTVTSAEDGMPIPGVNILVKGTTNGTQTDFDGNYSINVASSDAVLVFSYIGFGKQEIAVDDQSSINVTMAPDQTQLDEVVVVGYGTAKKETLSGSIEQVKSEVFEDRAVTNVGLALQGQTPGLIVNRNTARPGGEDINLQIRGATSINGGNPLIVIDGAPAFDDSEFFQMNPDDIASISVLKDGSASIYGSRAANGVILVTTKRGSGKMKVEFNTNLRANFLGINPPVPSMQQYGQLWIDANEQDLVPNSNWWLWTEDTVRGMAAGIDGRYQTLIPQWGVDGLLYVGDANRFDDLYGSNFGRQNTLSISGSSEKARYRLSIGESESQGALKTSFDGINQYSVRLNTDFDLTEKLNVTANIALNKNITSSPSSGFGRQLLNQDAPIFPAKNPQGQWYANFGVGNTNSIANTTEGGRREFVENIAKLTLNLNYDIGHGFSARFNGTFNHVNSREDLTNIAVPLYSWEGVQVNATTNNPTISAEHIVNEYQTYGGFLDYTKTVGKHNFTGLLGITAEKENFKALYGQRTEFVDEGVYDILVANGVQTNGGSGDDNDIGQYEEGLYSYLARLNYTYDDKYLIELVGRRDGSSRFAEGFKFGNYGSASVGWNVHKEKFLENADFLSNLKVRASIGSSGNQVGIGSVDYVSTIATGQDLFGTGGTLSPTAWVNGITTDQRFWEEVVMRNIGIDFGFFNNKLTGSFDTYERTNNDMLLNLEYPSPLGGEAPDTNSGTLNTTGWEAALNWRGGKDDFTYNIGVNMSDSNNIITDLQGAGLTIQAGFRDVVEGFPVNSYFGYETNGLFQTQAEVDAYVAQYSGDGSEVPQGASALRVGDVIKVDLDGNGIIDDQNANDPNGKGQGDVKFMGDAQAHYVFGINLGANFKNWDFQAFFQGHLEQTVLRNEVNAFPFTFPWPNQTIAYNGLTWTPENNGATYPRLTTQTGLARYNWFNNDIVFQNSRYIRLKTLIIGYNLPSSVIDKLNLDKLRIYFSGNDLWELTSLIDSFDPESGVTPASSDDGDINRSIYPFQRTIALGVNIAF